MVYLLYGKDLGKFNYYLDKIKFEEKNCEFITVDFSIDTTFAISTLYTPPMLSNRRLVIFEKDFADFRKIDFSQIHPNVDVVILQRGEFRAKLPRFDNLIVLEAKKPPVIFKFLDNLVFASVSNNLSTLFQILKAEDPNFVFAQIVNHFRRLICAKAGKFDENLADWQVEKYTKIANSLSWEKLKTAYSMLLAVEIDVKTGKDELAKILPLLILRLTRILEKP